MMELRYDPARGEQFWAAIKRIPGYPAGDEIPLRQMVFAAGALDHLPAVLQNAGASLQEPLLVVMDPTRMLRGADSLKPLLVEGLRQSGWEVETLVLSPDDSGQVHTDMTQIERVKLCLRPGIAVVSVGSGTITDIVKHACYLFESEGGAHLPLVVYQTANSVSAYTSSMAPVFIQGIKRTQSSRYPEALVCDLETLRDAPTEMTMAGVGDILAVFISLPDWFLAHRLGMDSSYTTFAQELIGPLDAVLVEISPAIRDRNLEGMAVLAKLISLAGLAMSLSHATTPFSGYEHVISHILDLINEQKGAGLATHGCQVGLTTLLASQAYQEFLDGFDPSGFDLTESYPIFQERRRHILETFAEIDPSGRAGKECWVDYQEKLVLWSGKRAELQGFLRDWSEIKPVLASLTRPPAVIHQILAGIGAPLKFNQLEPPLNASEVRFAFFNSPLMRKRFTLGDALIFFGWDREGLWKRILERGWV